MLASSRSKGSVSKKRSRAELPSTGPKQSKVEGDSEPSRCASCLLQARTWSQSALPLLVLFPNMRGHRQRAAAHSPVLVLVAPDLLQCTLFPSTSSAFRRQCRAAAGSDGCCAEEARKGEKKHRWVRSLPLMCAVALQLAVFEVTHRSSSSAAALVRLVAMFGTKSAVSCDCYPRNTSLAVFAAACSQAEHPISRASGGSQERQGCVSRRRKGESRVKGAWTTSRRLRQPLPRCLPPPKFADGALIPIGSACAYLHDPDL